MKTSKTSWQMQGGVQVPVDIGISFDLMVADKVYGTGHGWSDFCKCSGNCYPPSFSTDLTEAWSLVEKLKGEGFSFALYDVPNISSVSPAPIAVFKKGVHPPDWKTDISWPDGKPIDVFAACAETPQLAICLAAILAKASE